MKFYAFPAGLKMERWHGSPIPQIGLILSGGLEIETGEGEKRQWRAVEGSGYLLHVPLPPNFDIEPWST